MKGESNKKEMIKKAINFLKENTLLLDLARAYHFNTSDKEIVK